MPDFGREPRQVLDRTRFCMVTADLPDPFEQLVAFGRQSNARIRPVLLRVLVDMFVSKPEHTESDLRQFEEIVAHLLDDADDESRLAVAEQLAAHPSTPRNLLDRFVAERSHVAAKVLAQAGMDGRALSAAAVFGTTVMAAAVARRPDLDPAVVRSLAERPEIEVLCALVENRAAPIDRPLLRYIARRAEGRPDLASRLLERGQAPESVSVFLSADQARRAEMIAAARRQDLGVTARPLPFTPPPAALVAIERSSSVPGLEGLDHALASALSCSAQDAIRLIDDPHGEPLALALAALGVPTDVAARIFIMGPPAISHSYPKVRRLIEIVGTVSPRAAYKLLASILGLPLEQPRRATPAQEPSEPVRRQEPAPARREPPVRVASPKRINHAG